jgi:hypothetical protein
MPTRTVYFTRQGETWDSIAHTIWGNSALFPRLLEANSALREVLIFGADQKVVVPDLDLYAQEQASLPPWRKP